VDIKGSMIVEIAGILDTTTGYLMNMEVGAEDMDEQMKEMMELFQGLGSEQLKKVALEQLKVLRML